MSGESPAEYLAMARKVEAGIVENLDAVRVGVVSTFTVNQLRPYLIVEAARRGMAVEVQLGPFNQLEQELLAPSSDLHAFDPEAVVVAARLEELAPELIHSFSGLPVEHVEALVESAVGRLEHLARGFREHSSAPILLLNFAAPPTLNAGYADPLLEVTQTAAIQRANERLAQAARAVPAAFLVDFARSVAEVGTRHAYDPRLLHVGRIPLSPHGHRALGERLARTLRAVRSAPCKCLVVDLDNTLWGGVLGEDGLGGIQIGEDFPGNAFRSFQRAILSLRDRGILLAIASKNNAEDVREAFDSHPDLLVKPEHFAAMQIHWNEKASSLQAIATELNIGLDALAFFDDNPAERDWVRRRLPEVTVVDVPADPTRYVEVLDTSGAFDHLLVSAEDRKRAEHYATEGQRKELQASSESLEDFLMGLKVEVAVGRVGTGSLPRVVQLIGKTNQFNMTTRRHSAADLQAFAKTGHEVLWMRVRDRFGDHGLVGVSIAGPESEVSWRIDTFLLSCRVIGKRVEEALLAVVSRLAFDRGAQTLVGEFAPTKKNRPAEDFYERMGFVKADSEGHRWTFDLTGGPIPVPDLLTVAFVDAKE
jgi:FkbH-like protein